MSRFLLLLICAVLPLGLGCTAQPELPPGELLGDDDDDDDDDSPSLPDLIPESWIEGLTGSVIYDKNYVSGALEGTDCTESFSLAGVNITEVLPESCAGCEVIYSLYSSVEDDCPGGDDLEEEGTLAFDLDQDGETATMWWFVDGWNSDWYDLGTGSLVRDDSTLTFQFHFEWDDVDNGEWGGNFTADEPCSWGEVCSWEGAYVMDLTLAFVEGEDVEAR